MTDRPKTPSNDRRLSDIVRDVKISAADRTDVVVDMRDADRARLELLAEEIRPVLADIDPDDDRFDFGLSRGCSHGCGSMRWRMSTWAMTAGCFALSATRGLAG